MFYGKILKMNMKRRSILNGKNVSFKAGKFHLREKDLADEKLKRILRRVVKGVLVPADLEPRAWNLLRKQL